MQLQNTVRSKCLSVFRSLYEVRPRTLRFFAICAAVSIRTEFTFSGSLLCVVLPIFSGSLGSQSPSAAVHRRHNIVNFQVCCDNGCVGVPGDFSQLNVGELCKQCMVWKPFQRLKSRCGISDSEGVTQTTQN